MTKQYVDLTWGFHELSDPLNQSREVATHVQELTRGIHLVQVVRACEPEKTPCDQMICVASTNQFCGKRVG